MIGLIILLSIVFICIVVGIVLSLKIEFSNYKDNKEKNVIDQSNL